MDIIIEALKPGDWAEVSAIYLAGIRTGIATFQSDVPDWEDWDRSHCACCRLVARSGDAILGWAAITPVSSRCVYAGVANISVYVAKGYRGWGIGAMLLNELVLQSEQNGFWTLQSRIIKENTASRELHKKCGFREIGVEERLGRMPGGSWHDVVLMERRSKTVGV